MSFKWKLTLVSFLGLITKACGPAPGVGAALTSSELTMNIVGGRELVSTDLIALTTVALYDPATQQIRCTGSLVGNNLVLTAAHCLGTNPHSLYVLFTQNLAATNSSMARPIVGAIAYPGWGKNRNLPQNIGDIALLKYQGTTPPDYRAVSALSNTSFIKNGSPVILAGYGHSDGVRKKGAGILRQVTTVIADSRYSVSEMTVDQRRGQGACNGDSGGPAFVQVNGGLYFWGISSRGLMDLKGDCSSFSIYTNIQPYINWLQETARSLILKNQFSFPTF